MMSAEGERRSYFDQKITQFLEQNCGFSSKKISRFAQIIDMFSYRIAMKALNRPITIHLVLEVVKFPTI